MKKAFRYLLLASFVFLAIALYKADYLAVPRVHSAAALALSIAALVAGSLADTLSWRSILARSGFPAGFAECLAAVGLSSFAKYIPGKVWAAMGRAAFVSERRSYSLAHLTSVSFTWQLTVLWFGLIFGGAGLVLLRAPLVWGLVVLAMWVALTAVIFSNAAQAVAARVYRKLRSRKIEFPKTPPLAILAAAPWFLLLWAMYTGGFHLLVTGLTPERVAAGTGLGFPLALTAGLLAFIAPGGLGVREGVMVGYLVLAGLPVAEATAVSIAARLWFLAGEVLTFALGLAVSSALRRKTVHRMGA
jgi:uncharacterized membrane protein YbhN (UPF0104 family)